MMNIRCQETFHWCMPTRMYLYPYLPVMIFSVRYINTSKLGLTDYSLTTKNGIINLVFVNKDYGISRPEIKKAQRRF